MDFLEKHPWRQLVVKTIESDIGSPISDDNTDWEYLDGEMIKLGSLEHNLLDIQKIQSIALSLLSTKSKDLRILGHLIRTLQHSGNVLDLLLGLTLLNDYVKTFWAEAAPSATLKKNRLGQQILKRFESASTSFSNHASRREKDEASQLFDGLIKEWKTIKAQSLVDDAERIKQRYLLPPEVIVSKKSNPEHSHAVSSHLQDSTQEETGKNIFIEPIEIDSSNDRAWKNTLLKVADYLTEKDEKSPIGYVLRRYAMWSLIMSAPISEKNRTPLAPPLVDRTIEYETALSSANLNIWKELEYSLTLSPYWFDGHYISAKMAEQLGLKQVAIAIKNSVGEFIERLPVLKELTFSDSSPFVPSRVLEWIAKESSVKMQQHGFQTNNNDIFNIFNNEGLVAALDTLNNKGTTELRQQVYDQVILGELLSKSSLNVLAVEHYSSIYRSIENLTVKEWEPSLFLLLENKINESE